MQKSAALPKLASNVPRCICSIWMLLVLKSHVYVRLSAAKATYNGWLASSNGSFLKGSCQKDAHFLSEFYETWDPSGKHGFPTRLHTSFATWGLFGPERHQRYFPVKPITLELVILLRTDHWDERSPRNPRHPHQEVSDCGFGPHLENMFWSQLNMLAMAYNHIRISHCRLKWKCCPKNGPASRWRVSQLSDMENSLPDYCSLRIEACLIFEVLDFSSVNLFFKF